MTSLRRAMPLLALAAASALILSGCAAASGADATDGRIDVVASTSVYGQIAKEIGGDAVDVTSIISSPSQDPHSFEPSAQDQLAVKRADLVIENGAGYDTFAESLIKASGSTAPVITAVDFSPEWPGGDQPVEGFNEHIWYDPPTMALVANEIAHELGTLAPDAATTFEQNAKRFSVQIDGLNAKLGAIKDQHAGAKIFVTEPVPLYLTDAAGLTNVAPAAFTQAVEEGQDVAPATLLETLTLLRSGDVSLVIANSQTGGAETTQVIDEAKARSIPVIEVSETLPDGKTYVTWMQANIAALVAALAS